MFGAESALFEAYSNLNNTYQLLASHSTCPSCFNNRNQLIDYSLVTYSGTKDQALHFTKGRFRHRLCSISPRPILPTKDAQTSRTPSRLGIIRTKCFDGHSLIILWVGGAAVQRLMIVAILPGSFKDRFSRCLAVCSAPPPGRTETWYH